MKGQFSKQEIANLLNKFMAGETSLDEENILAQYFRTHEVSDEWKEYKEMFAMFDGGMVEVSLPLSPSKGRGTQSRFSSLSLWRGRGVRLVGAIAASIVIAFILWPDNLVEEQPVIAEVVEEQPVQEAPKVSENSEVSENSDKSEPSEPVKPKRTYRVRKAIEEPQLAEAEEMPEEAEVKMEQECLSAEPDPFLLAAVEAQDIRSRGEHLFHEVVQMINNR